MHLLFSEDTDTYFIDATTIKDCHNKRRYRNKTFKVLALAGKSSMGYFYGFKLHLVINEKGQFIALKMTKDTVLSVNNFFQNFHINLLINLSNFLFKYLY